MSPAHESRVPVVAIGASAGGVEALEQFFRAVPRKTGAAFAVITHLNPKRESLLAKILQRYTEIPVEIIADGMVALADHIYVMPENATLTIAGGRFQMAQLDGAHRQYAPIDLFMSALALDLGDRAIGVVLSGSDGDGTIGCKAIKERGGLTLAQAADGTAPKYPGMPDTAIASGMIDFAIPVQDMPKRIAAYATGFPGDPTEEVEAEDREFKRFEGLRDDICALLRGRVGHDFSGYKARTFNRRVQRRRQLLQIASVEEYVERLRQEPSEIVALFRDLLINVTNFFRDRDAFDSLQALVIPALFEGKGLGDTVRIWVPGCATGEEVYSIAILLREHLDTLEVQPRVQVFATDIDERSLGVARAARYPEPMLENVTPERRARFFTGEGSSYVLNKDVRELCVFSPHSIIRDPPFSRMELVSCRNLLIYLAPSLQGQVMPLFHYALRPGGFLFLGTSENVGQFSDLFAPLDKKQRLFKARDMPSGTMRLPALVRSAAAGISEVGRHPKQSSLQNLRHEIEARVLDRWAPAYVVINADSDIIFYSSRTGKYLEAAAGVPTRQLLGMARKGVRLELRSAIRESVSSHNRAERTGLTIETDDQRTQTLNLVVEPLDIGTNEPLYIVVFVDTGPTLDREHAPVARSRPSDKTAMAAMERELGETRERLQSMIEEYETALEELKSSNEELVSVNEELQSTNEELEASKEELQSLNEELQTVNAELGVKIDELDSVNSDLRNLFDTSKIASVLVNDDLRIRNFTPLAEHIFSLLPGDRGRSLATFTIKLVYRDFLSDLESVLATGQSVETRVPHMDGVTRYLVRIQRYREEMGALAGATLTFVDITTLADL